MGRNSLPLLVCALALLVAPAASHAGEDSQVGTSVETTLEAPRNYLNLRAGATSGSANGRPEICMEGSPLAVFSLEACGTGSGFLHHDPDPELAHFRAKILLGSSRRSFGWLQAHAHAGFAELQVGRDDPGFDFAGTGSSRNETAGPEAGLSLRALMPIARGTELVTELAATFAWLPHAPELSRPSAAAHPSVSLNLGVGF